MLRLAGRVPCVLVGLLVAICAIGFAGRQYRRLRRLSACLERICAGDYSLDVRNNDEGELSILQNDIHKVTRILREQNQRLTEEKTRLADSMSDISHQLKTPLTSMMMLADLLQSPDLLRIVGKSFQGDCMRSSTGWSGWYPLC